MASNSVQNICGTWILEKSENFDEFMKELGSQFFILKFFYNTQLNSYFLGVNFILRKAGNMVVPTLIIACEGDRWTFKMRSSFKNTDDEFKIGEEFDDGLY